MKTRQARSARPQRAGVGRVRVVTGPAAWFASRGWKPFPFQREVWREMARGTSGLVHAPTGTGKTLAAWLGALARARTLGQARALGQARTLGAAGGLRVVWLTPLKALAADTVRAL